MPDTRNPGGAPLTRNNYTPAFPAQGGRQVAAGSARQPDRARAQRRSTALPGRWQRPAIA